MYFSVYQLKRKHFERWKIPKQTNRLGGNICNIINRERTTCLHKQINTHAQIDENYQNGCW